MKQCRGCRQSKPLTEFRKHNSNVDGLTGKCKTCLQQDRKVREASNTVIPQTKICVRCNEKLDSSLFLLNKSSKDGLNGWCKRCTKDATLLHRYGLSVKTYEELLKKQNNRCAICGTLDPKGPTSQFCVDHCHKTSRVRGLLCNHCNTGLGKLGDTVESLKKAIRYLESC